MSVKMNVLLVVLLTGLALMACAPSAAPRTPATSPTNRPAADIPKAAPGPQSVADPAWDKVVEAARKEGKVTVYSYNFTSDVGVAVSDAFKRKYGITVDLITGRGAEIAERIKTEKRTGSVVADLMDTNSVQISNLTDAGITESSKEIPALRDNVWQVSPSLDPEGHILLHTLFYYDTWINTKLVAPGQEPKSLKELAQPKWKGKIIMHDPAFSSAVYDFYIRLLRRNAIDLDTVKALGKNVDNFAINAPTAATEIAKGTYAVQPGMVASNYTPVLKEGAPVRAITLEEGTVTADLAIAAIKGGPHPNAAKLFNNWVMSPDGQEVLQKAQGGRSARSDVPDFRLPAAQTKPARLIGATLDDIKESTRLFQERYLVKLWKE